MVRRTFLQAAAILPLSSWATLASGNKPSSASPLIVRQKDPDNLETPPELLRDFITPNEHFFVRNHFKVPELKVDAWRLSIEGSVRKPLTLTYEDLLKLPAKTITVTVECSGNGRGFLTPKQKGDQWERGAVGYAEWQGVLLSDILESAGAKPEAVEVILEGADKGEIKEDPKSPGEIHFARSLPTKNVRALEVLLAYRMNRKDLPVSHGFPLRAVVPGWYGMASVKWLRRVIVVDRPFFGFFQTLDYTYFVRQHGLPTLVPTSEMQVKAIILHPKQGESLAANKTFRVRGMAWAGPAAIARVQLSTDRGKTWKDAKLVGLPERYKWQLWEYDWQDPRSGALMAKATDENGKTQPDGRDRDRRGYMINHVMPINVTVS